MAFSRSMHNGPNGLHMSEMYVKERALDEFNKGGGHVNIGNYNVTNIGVQAPTPAPTPAPDKISVPKRSVTADDLQIIAKHARPKEGYNDPLDEMEKVLEIPFGDIQKKLTRDEYILSSRGGRFYYVLLKCSDFDKHTLQAFLTKLKPLITLEGLKAFAKEPTPPTPPPPACVTPVSQVVYKNVQEPFAYASSASQAMSQPVITIPNRFVTEDDLRIIIRNIGGNDIGMREEERIRKALNITEDDVRTKYGQAYSAFEYNDSAFIRKFKLLRDFSNWHNVLLPAYLNSYKVLITESCIQEFVQEYRNTFSQPLFVAGPPPDYSSVMKAAEAAAAKAKADAEVAAIKHAERMNEHATELEKMFAAMPAMPAMPIPAMPIPIHMTFDATPQEECYNFKPNTAVWILINISNYESHVDVPSRTGSDVDMKNLLRFLDRRDFKTYWYEDVNGEDIIPLLEGTIESVGEISLLAFTISAHGHNECVTGKNGVQVSMNSIVGACSPRRHHKIRGIPVFGQFQVCRGDKLPNAVRDHNQNDTRTNKKDTPHEKLFIQYEDAYFICSTTGETQSMRSETFGGIYLRVFNECLGDYPTLEIKSLFTRVCDETTREAVKYEGEMRYQCPTDLSSLRKSLYLMRGAKIVPKHR